MKYDRTNINNTLQVAQKSAIRTRTNHYVFATAYGYKINKETPPLKMILLGVLKQRFYVINPQGKIILFSND